MFQIKIDDNSNLILIWPHHHFQQNVKELFCQKYITSVSSRKWPALAAKSHTRQKIIHNSVKTYDILMK